MYSSRLSSSTALKTDASLERCNAVILNVDHHLFALPTTAVLKIEAFSASIQSAQTMPLWEGYPLLLLDLHQILAVYSSHLPDAELPSTKGTGQKTHLIITRASGLDRCAIAVDELPTFQDIPLANVQELSHYHYRLTGSIAKHRVTLPYKGVLSTVLLLDLQHALYRWQIMKTSTA